MLAVNRFTLVETTTGTVEQFAMAAKRQWAAGLHRISLTIVAAGSSQPLGSSPPQPMSGISLGLAGMLAVPVSAATAFPVLVKVMAHPTNAPGTVLGIATVDASGFFAASSPSDSGASTGADDASANNSELFVETKHHMTIPVFPTAGLRPDTIHAVVALELTIPPKRIAPPPTSQQQDGGAIQRLSAPHALQNTASVCLEHTCGPLRLSTLDLYFPAFARTTDTLTVSNVICACNVSSVHLWLNLQTSGSLYTVTPSGGLVLRPGQRGYFAVTLLPLTQQGGGAAGAAAGAGGAAGPQGGVPGTPGSGNERATSTVFSAALSASGEQTVELFCVEVDTSEAHPPVAFSLHDDAPRSAADLIRPYHFWLNGSCVTNRPLPVDEASFVRSVLPVFSPGAATADGAVVETDALSPDMPSRSVVGPGANVTPGRAWPVRRDGDGAGSAAGGGPGGDAAALAVKDRDSGAIMRTESNTGRVVPASPSRLIVDLAHRACRCSIKLGRIAGTVIPAPRVCGPYQPGYRAVLTSMHPSWKVENGETPVVLPNAVSGDIDFSPFPVIVRKEVAAEPHQCLRVTLMEVQNAAASGATVVPNVNSMELDEVPIALGVVTVYPLHRSPMLRSLPLSLLFLDSFSRYDDMDATGVAMRGSDITFVPLEGAPRKR